MKHIKKKSFGHKGTIIKMNKTYSRTSKHSLKHLTKSKKKFLWNKRNEWAFIANKFIYKYDKEVLSGDLKLKGSQEKKIKGALQPYVVKEIIKELPFKATSRFTKNAINSAFRAIKSQKVLMENGERTKYTRPKIKPRMMELNEDIATFIPKDKISNKEYDGLIKLSSLGLEGKNQSIYIPYKETSFSNKLNETFDKRCKTIKLGNTLNISYASKLEKKKDNGQVVAIDLNCSDDLISTSTRKHYGLEIRKYINNLNNKKQYSKSYYQAKKFLYHYIDECLNEFYNDHKDISYLLVEKLKNVKKNSKLHKSARKVINNWYYAYILKKLEGFCDANCVRIRRLPTPYLSQKCSQCDFIDKKNRNGEFFHCKNELVTNGKQCNHKDHSGFNACDNMLNLFFFGAYCPEFKTKFIDKWNIYLSF